MGRGNRITVIIGELDNCCQAIIAIVDCKLQREKIKQKHMLTIPALYKDTLEHKGKCYRVGTNRQEVKDTKTEDDSFKLLTYAVIAKELKRRGLTESRVFLVVGLVLTRFGAEKKPFIIYYGRKGCNFYI
jgi:hypothetical protein